MIVNNKYSRAVRLLMVADRLHRSAVEAEVQRLGIHRSQHVLLMHIARKSGEGTELTQKDIAEATEISPSAAAVTLKKLESAGLIERREREGDSRANIIVLTDRARELVKETEKLFSDVDSCMFGGMSDEDIRSFTGYLTNVIGNLKTRLGERDESPETAKEGGKRK